MGDSDDDYDRRRGREKFRRERSDYNNDRRRDRDERPSRGRDDWNDRRRDQNWETRRRDYRDLDRSRRDNSGRHQEMSPPVKRMRRDWDSEQQQYHGDYNMTQYSNMHQQQAAAHWGQQHAAGTDIQAMQHMQEQKRGVQDVEPTQGLPAMLTFKQFLQNMDDNIDDVEAVKKYQEYKLEFRKTRLADFFTAHKDEEWFKMKYHPKDSSDRRRELLNAMKRRAAVFLEMLKTESIEKAALDINNAEAIVKLMDSVVIKLEGGSDEDLAILDIPEPSPGRERSLSGSVGPEDVPAQNGEDPVTKPAEHISTDKRKEETPLDLAPVSPSSVPLPDAPPPPSAHIKKPAVTSKDANGAVNMTPDQQQLQQTQYYKMYYQQPSADLFPPGTEKPAAENQTADAPKVTKDKEKGSKKQDLESKKKRKRRHREPYYYDEDAEEESESESDSDSEPEPAPPGEESAGLGTSSQEDDLLPPGVEREAKPIEEPLPPGIDEPMVDSAPSAVAISETTEDPKKTPDDSQNVSVDPPKSEDQNKDDTSTEEKEAVSEKESKDAEMKDVDTATATTTDQTDSSQVKTSQPYATDEATKEVSEDNKDKQEEKNEIEPMETQTSESIPKQEAGESAESHIAKTEEPKTTETEEPKTTETEDRAKDVASSAEPEKSEEANDKETKAKTPVGSVEDEQTSKPDKDSSSSKTPGEDGQTAMEEGEEKNDEGKVQEPRPLHKTYSLFMRNIPPNISRNDIIPICKRFPGFLRVSLSDPSPDRQFYRRGWISFDRTVNIKDICWNFSNVRVKDTDLNPVVNRDLQRRVRPVAGFTVCKPVVKADIKLAARLIKALDTKAGLWGENKEEKERQEKEKCKEEPEEGEEKDVKSSEGEEEIIELPAENPVLSSLSEDVAEEEEGEEMELLGSASPERKADDVQSDVNLKRDDNMIKVLDRLLLYLRIVHSMDYYNGAEYPYEDEMPNRCGIIHVRGVMPETLTQQEITEWNKNLEQKLEPHLQEKERLPAEEAEKLGKKDPEAEVEKFVQANTQELAKDKWLCPLSGKKFRGPEFVRKHIFNKQMERVEGVKMEAEFFNSYLYDPKRPQTPEIKPVTASSTPSNVPMNRGAGYSQGQYTPQGIQQIGSWNQQRTHMMMQHGGHRGYHTPQQYSNYGHSDMYSRGQTYPSKPRRNFNQRGGRGGSDRGFHRDSRQLVQYRDLDAPDDADLF